MSDFTFLKAYKVINEEQDNGLDKNSRISSMNIDMEKARKSAVRFLSKD